MFITLLYFRFHKAVFTSFQIRYFCVGVNMYIFFVIIIKLSQSKVSQESQLWVNQFEVDISAERNYSRIFMNFLRTRVSRLLGQLL